MKVLTGPFLRYAVLILGLTSPLIVGAAGCSQEATEQASNQATKESESKYDQAIKQNTAKGAQPKK